MASRLTGRREVVLARWSDPERSSVIHSYCEPRGMGGHIEVVTVGHDPDHRRPRPCRPRAEALATRTAALYVESPSYLGVIEAEGELAWPSSPTERGALLIVGADPISLGVLAAPADWGADIVVGPTQPLGVHMNCGGGVGGYIASRDEERFVREYDGFLVSITGTSKPGQFGFGLASAHQTSYGMRELGKDWTGNSVYLWAVANAVYLALLGPQGMREVGETILQRRAYAARQLASIPGVTIPFPSCFKEFVVDFSKTGRSVAAINEALRRGGIFGGKDLS